MRRSWRFLDGMMVAVLVAIAIYATRDVWMDIVGLAIRSEESSYILLTPLVVGWLAWLRRERVRYCRPRPTPFGAVVIAAGWGLMALGNEHAINLFRDFGALLVVLGAVLAITGFDIFFRFRAAWLAVLFLVPVPGRIRHHIAIPMQQASAETTHFILQLFAVPVEQRGNVLLINEVEVAIAEACNGMRMVAAMALIAYAFVFSFPMRTWARIVLLGISPIVAILVNVLRLVPTTILYGQTSADFASAFHDVAGWVVLFLAIGIMWLVLALMRYLELPIAPCRIREEA